MLLHFENGTKNFTCDAKEFKAFFSEEKKRKYFSSIGDAYFSIPEKELEKFLHVAQTIKGTVVSSTQEDFPESVFISNITFKEKYK